MQCLFSHAGAGVPIFLLAYTRSRRSMPSCAAAATAPADPSTHARKSECKECWGSGVCEHDRIRSLCKECNGLQICEHDRRRSRCKEFLGTSICPHSASRATGDRRSSMTASGASTRSAWGRASAPTRAGRSVARIVALGHWGPHDSRSFGVVGFTLCDDELGVKVSSFQSGRIYRFIVIS